MRLRICIGFLVLVAVSAVTAIGQTQGSVRVRVRTEGTEKAIAGVNLVLTPSPSCTECLEIVSKLPENEQDLLAYLTQLAVDRGVVSGQLNIGISSGGNIKLVFPTAVTDAEGNAIFRDVQPGRYTVSAQHSEYAGIPIKQPGDFFYATRRTSSGVVFVNEKDRSPEAIVFLSPVSSIGGRVRNPDGSPAVNARVTLGTLRLEGGRRTFLIGPAVRTNAAGEYLLTRVGSGDYTLRALAASPGAQHAYYPGNADLEKAALIFVGPGKAFVGIDITLPDSDTFSK